MAEVNGQLHAPADLAWEQSPRIHCVADWVGPRADLDDVASRYTDYAVFLLPMLMKSELTATSCQETNDYGVPASNGSDSIRDLDTVYGSARSVLLPRPLFACAASTPGWEDPMTALQVEEKRNILPYCNPPIQYIVYVPEALSLGIRPP